MGKNRKKAEKLIPIQPGGPGPGGGVKVLFLEQIFWKILLYYVQ